MTATQLKTRPVPAQIKPEEEDAPRTVLLSPHEVQRLLARRILVVRLDLRPEGLAVGVSEAVEGEPDTSPMEVRPIKIQELRAFAESTRNILEKGSGDPNSNQRLQELGFRMYQKLFGPAARKIFASSVAENLLLYVKERLAGIHWELIHDGHDFLCLLFNMGRWPADLSTPKLRSVAQGIRRMIILANPMGDTASAQEEGKLLGRAMTEYPQRVKGILWEKDILCNRLLRMGKVNIMHYAGPIQYVTKEPASTGWILKDGLVPWSNIWEKVRGPDLLFAHACKWEPPGSRAVYSPREVAAFARPLFERGGSLYLGTLHCANESESLYFVEPFYRELLEGAMVGQAVRRSRLSLMNRMGEEFLLWSGYILYGMPTQRIFPGQGE